MFERLNRFRPHADSRISPTAHYTGYVWRKNGLGYRGLSTWTGAFGYYSTRGVDRLHDLIFGASLEGLLLARHRWLNERVERFVAHHPSAQVVEVAAGLTPRGRRMVERFDGIEWWEADLPGMAKRKTRTLLRHRLDHPRLRIEAVDAFATEGPLSLEHLFAGLEPDRPVLVITEGLLNYFDTPKVEALWRRVSRALGEFPAGTYISGVVGEECMRQLPTVRPFGAGLGAAARGRVSLHYPNAEACHAALEQCGFQSIDIEYPDPTGIYRMVEARV